VLTGALLTITKDHFFFNKNPLVYLSLGNWVNEIWSIFETENSAVIKKKQVSQYALTWKDI
jgi:hypothetical protein